MFLQNRPKNFEEMTRKLPTREYGRDFKELDRLLRPQVLLPNADLGAVKY